MTEEDALKIADKIKRGAVPAVISKPVTGIDKSAIDGIHMAKTITYVVIGILSFISMTGALAAVEVTKGLSIIQGALIIGVFVFIGMLITSTLNYFEGTYVNLAEINHKHMED